MLRRQIRHYRMIDMAVLVTYKAMNGRGTTVPRATPERLSAFSDGVFAVLITVLVLELRPANLAGFVRFICKASSLRTRVTDAELC